MTATLIVVIVAALLVLLAVIKAVLVVPQSTAAVIERLGRYRTTAMPGLNFRLPFLDRVRVRLDLREQVVSFPPRLVTAADGRIAAVKVVLYFQVSDAHDAVYQTNNYILGLETLTDMTLQNLAAEKDMSALATSSGEITTRLRGTLDEAILGWGIRINRIDVAIDRPPADYDPAKNPAEEQTRKQTTDYEQRAIIRRNV